MKNILTLILLFSTITIFSQIQENAPWSKETDAQRRGNITLQEISNAAETYFNSIDINKKGSGYKPFKRWQYNWSNFTNKNGELSTKEDLWKAWKQKNELSNRDQSRTDQSNWQPLGPYMNANTYNANNQKQTGQGRVNAVAVDPNNPNTYYVGTPAGGIWKSTDAGVNWTPLIDNLPQIGVSGIAVHPTNPNIIYIATGDDDAGDSFSVGVWKSIDGGSTWKNTGSLQNNPNNTHEIYIHPNSPNTILVATSTGVQKTTNGGSNWTTVLNGNIRDLKMKPGDPSVWYAVTNNAFYRSDDTGDSFTSVELPGLGNSTRLAMDVTIANDQYIYIVSAGAGNSFNGVYKSTDSGQTFVKSPTGSVFGGSTQAWYDLALTISSNDPDIVYVGVLDIYKSINGGDSFSRLNNWSNPNTNSYTHADIHFLRFIDGKFFAGTDGGVFVSTDEGINFIDLTKNLAISQFYRISVSPQNYTAINGGIQDNGGYGYSGNGWKNWHGGDGMEGVVDPNNQNKYYGFIQFGGRLNITENGGQSISRGISSPNGEINNNGVSPGGAWVTPLSINSQGELYAGYNSLYKLTNNSWEKVSNDLGSDLDQVKIDPNNNNNIYVSRGSRLYKSTNKGVSLVQLTDFNFGNINSIEVSNNNSNIIWVATNNGVYKSINITDASPTFTDITGNLPSESKLAIKHHNRSGKNTIYLGTALGVYFINDDVTEWETFDNGLPNTQIRDLDINEEEGKLIAATYGRGIFISDIPRVLPKNDVRILSLNNINNNFLCENTVSPEIKVKNQGTSDITSLTINYTFDSGTPNQYNWSGNIPFGQETTITIPSSNLSLDSHTVEIEAIVANDTYPNNNSVSGSFTLNNYNTTPTTINTFENTNDKLLVISLNQNEPLWEIATPNKTLLNTSASGGTKAYVTKSSANYPIGTTSYLYTNCYNLSLMSSPVLSFKMAFDIENNWDYLTIEYSTDFGTSWGILGSSSDNNWYNSSTTNGSLPGAQWSGNGTSSNSQGGTNATLHDYSYDLAAFSASENIIFRFKFSSDNFPSNNEGVVIDNLFINGVLSVDNFNLLNNIAIYPNPSESIFNLNWNTGDALNIKVYDITGKQIFTKKNITNNSYQLDLSGYAQGIYLLNMNMNGKTATKKLILK